MMLHPLLLETSIPITQLTLSDLLLKNNKNYPWLILVPRVENTIELFNLTPDEYTQVTQELYNISLLMKNIFAPDKINIGSLGNIVPQLHIHVIARYKNDMSWPLNPWSDTYENPYTKDEILELKQKILNYL